MGFFSDVVSGMPGLGEAVDFIDGTILGGDAADAAKDASRTQAQATEKAIELQRETRDLAREDLAPFRTFGADQINSLTSILSPEGQMSYLQSNPLFQLGLDNLNQTTMQSQAARGKLGSGGTLTALQDNAYLAGAPLLQNQQNQLFNAVNLGQSSAAGQANTALTTGNNLSNLTMQQGNNLAAGIVGAQGARQAGINNLLNLGGQIGGAYAGNPGAFA